MRTRRLDSRGKRAFEIVYLPLEFSRCEPAFLSPCRNNRPASTDP